MAIKYIDPINGLDTNSGADWANAWKTITSGATNARITAGDEIRIAKSPDAVSLGTTGKWTENTKSGGLYQATTNVSGAVSNGGKIKLTVTTTTYATGDIVQVRSVVGATEANGNWTITVDDGTHMTLEGSTFVNNYVSGGVVGQFNAKCILMADAQTKLIDSCEKAWTNAAGGDATCSIAGGEQKYGGVYMSMQLDSAIQTNILQCYRATNGTLDLSAYQKITLWVKNRYVITNATTYTITLCSDNAGATPVDTFVIPAIPSTARWQPLTLTKEGGGNLGASIQSIAISTGATAPQASSYLYLDDISACTTDGLNLQSLVSKSSSQQGGSWYPIMSLSEDGKIIMVDADTANNAYTGRGYYETSETVTLYKRETIKTTMQLNSTGNAALVDDYGGAPATYLKYTGGWDTSTGNQTGETWFDGLNGYGRGLYAAKVGNYVDRINFTRYWFGYYAYTNTLSVIGSMSCVGCYTGMYLDNSQGFYANSLVLNCNQRGLYTLNSWGLRAGDVTVESNVTNGMQFDVSTFNVDVANLKSVSNNFPGISGSKSRDFRFGGSTIMKGNSIGITTDLLNMQFNNLAVAYNTSNFAISGTGGASGYYIDNYNGTGNAYSYLEFATLEQQTSTMTNGSGKEWKVTMTGNSGYRDINNPVKVPVATVACVASKLVTVKCWFKKSHATNIAAKLMFPPQLGVATTSVTKTNDTNEEELTVTFTPAYAGVAKVEAWVYALTSTDGYVLIDAITVTQAD